MKGGDDKMTKKQVRTALTVEDFNALKQDIKQNGVMGALENTQWSETTLRRIKKARSLKHYRTLCMES